MNLNLTITDAPEGFKDVGKPRIMRATWADSPRGPFAIVWGTTLWPEDLDDAVVRDGAESNVRRAYEAAYASAPD